MSHSSVFRAVVHCFRTLSLVVFDLVRLAFLAAHSRSALAAENLFLRKKGRRFHPVDDGQEGFQIRSGLHRGCGPIKLALLSHCPQITRVMWTASWRADIRKRIFQDPLFPI